MMTFLLNDEQKAMEKVAADFGGDHLPIDQLRKLRDDAEPIGFYRDVWSKMAELGLSGMATEERWGGLGLGFVEFGLVMEQLGRHLASTPMLSTALLGALAMQRSSNAALCEEYLPGIAKGQTILALAFEEASHFRPYQVETCARKTGSGWSISGCKQLVLNGDCADAYIVSARTSGELDDRSGLSLFVLPAETPGISKRSSRMVDSRLATNLSFDQVVVDQMSILSEIDHGADRLDTLLDIGTIVLCAEMLGGIQEVFERTIVHLKERRQFGVAIGSFQGLQHRAAQMFCEIELSKSIVREALNAADEDRDDLSALASVAKARCNDTFLLTANEAIQMHGGMGVTDELDIGFFLKRARVCSMMFGDSAYHRLRFAQLNGF